MKSGASKLLGHSGVFVAILCASLTGKVYGELPEIPSMERVRILTGPIDLTWRDFRGRSQLYYLVAFGSQQKAIEFLERTKVAPPRMEDGERLLVFAVAVGAAEVVRWLLRNGENPDALKRGDRVPLQIAVELGRLEITEYLLANGANVNAARDPSQSTLAYSALHTGNEDAFFLLVSNGLDLRPERAAAKQDLLFAGAVGDAEQAIRYLIAFGFDPDARNADGRTPLMVAAGLGNKNAVRALLTGSAKPCLRGPTGESAVDISKKAITRDGSVVWRELANVRCQKSK
jgi:ankyrin repeat protein